MHVKTLYGSIGDIEFRREYVDKNIPVIVKGYASDWDAVKYWCGDYFAERYGKTYIRTKDFAGNGEIHVAKSLLSDYIASIDAYEKTASSDSRNRPAYWHDVPIFELYPELVADVNSFQRNLLPEYYRLDWHRYVQFFMSTAESVTKLHFDTLCTHNLFFQIKGRKKWIMMPPSDERLCGRKKWRWFELDPDSPDLEKFPEYANASPTTVLVEPGDMLYIPPRTLHHVTSLDTCISFNIDFHTPSSVLKSFRHLHRGMPKEVVYYNLIAMLGVVGKLPSKWLFPLYRSYLNFIS